MYKIKVFIIFSLIAVISCSGKEDKTIDLSDEKDLKLSKVRDFIIKDDSLVLDRVRDAIVFNENYSRIAWVNEDKNMVVVTDTTGKIVTSFGGKGRGPSQFINITSLGFNKRNQVVVFDYPQDIIKTFSLKGDLIESNRGFVDEKIWPRSNKMFFADSTFYMAIQESEKAGPENYWESRIIAEIKDDGRLLSLFGEYEPTLVNAGSDFYKYANIVVDADKNVAYTTHRTSHFIQKFNLEDKKKISRLGHKTPTFNISDEIVTRADPRFIKNKKNLKQSFVGNSFISEDYFLFYFFNFTEEFFDLRNPNKKENFFYIYDSELNAFIGEISLPFAPLGVTNKGKIYLLESDNPDNLKVGIYELI